MFSFKAATVRNLSIGLVLTQIAVSFLLILFTHSAYADRTDCLYLDQDVAVERPCEEAQGTGVFNLTATKFTDPEHANQVVGWKQNEPYVDPKSCTICRFTPNANDKDPFISAAPVERWYKQPPPEGFSQWLPSHFMVSGKSGWSDTENLGRGGNQNDDLKRYQYYAPDQMETLGCKPCEYAKKWYLGEQHPEPPPADFKICTSNPHRCEGGGGGNNQNNTCFGLNDSDPNVAPPIEGHCSGINGVSKKHIVYICNSISACEDRPDQMDFGPIDIDGEATYPPVTTNQTTGERTTNYNQCGPCFDPARNSHAHEIRTTNNSNIFQPYNESNEDHPQWKYYATDELPTVSGCVKNPNWVDPVPGDGIYDEYTAAASICNTSINTDSVPGGEGGDNSTTLLPNKHWRGGCGSGMFFEDNDDIWPSRTGCYNPEERFAYVAGAYASVPELRNMPGVLKSKQAGAYDGDVPFFKQEIVDKYTTSNNFSSDDIVGGRPRDDLLVLNPLCLYNAEIGFSDRRVGGIGNIIQCLNNDYNDDMADICRGFWCQAGKYNSPRWAWNAKDSCWKRSLIDTNVRAPNGYCEKNRRASYEHWMPLAITTPSDLRGNRINRSQDPNNPTEEFLFGRQMGIPLTGTPYANLYGDLGEYGFHTDGANIIRKGDEILTNKNSSLRLSKEWNYNPSNIYNHEDLEDDNGTRYDILGGSVPTDEQLKLVLDPSNMGMRAKYTECVKIQIEEYAHLGDCGRIILDGASEAVDQSHCQWVVQKEEKKPPHPMRGLRSEAFDYENFISSGWVPTAALLGGSPDICERPLLRGDGLGPTGDPSFNGIGSVNKKLSDQIATGSRDDSGKRGLDFSKRGCPTISPHNLWPTEFSKECNMNVGASFLTNPLEAALNGPAGAIVRLLANVLTKDTDEMAQQTGTGLPASPEDLGAFGSGKSFMTTKIGDIRSIVTLKPPIPMVRIFTNHPPKVQTSNFSPLQLLPSEGWLLESGGLPVGFMPHWDPGGSPNAPFWVSSSFCPADDQNCLKIPTGFPIFPISLIDNGSDSEIASSPDRKLTGFPGAQRDWIDYSFPARNCLHEVFTDAMGETPDFPIAQFISDTIEAQQQKAAERDARETSIRQSDPGISDADLKTQADAQEKADEIANCAPADVTYAQNVQCQDASGNEVADVDCGINYRNMVKQGETEIYDCGETASDNGGRQCMGCLAAGGARCVQSAGTADSCGTPPQKLFGFTFSVALDGSEIRKYTFIPNVPYILAGVIGNYTPQWCAFQLPLDPYHVGVEKTLSNYNPVALYSHINRKMDSGTGRSDKNMRLEFQKVERIRNGCGPFSQRATWIEDPNVGLSKFLTEEDPVNEPVRSRCQNWRGYLAKNVGANPKIVSWRLPRFDYEFLKAFIECTGPYKNAQSADLVCDTRGSPLACLTNVVADLAGGAIPEPNCPPNPPLAYDYIDLGSAATVVPGATNGAKNAIMSKLNGIANTIGGIPVLGNILDKCGLGNSGFSLGNLQKCYCLGKNAVAATKAVTTMVESIECEDVEDPENPPAMIQKCKPGLETLTSGMQLAGAVSSGLKCKKHGNNTPERLLAGMARRINGECYTTNLTVSALFSLCAVTPMPFCKADMTKNYRIAAELVAAADDCTAPMQSQFYKKVNEPYGFWCSCPDDVLRTTQCREDLCTCEQAVMITGLYPGSRPAAVCRDYGPFYRWLKCYYQARAKACPVLFRDISSGIAPSRTLLTN